MTLTGRRAYKLRSSVSALERKGIETNIGNLNRDIKAANRMMNAIRSTIKNLRNWIADIVAATKEAFAEMEAERKMLRPLSELLRDYMNLRKAERSEWSRYGQQKGTADDLKAVSKALIYLKEHELFTLEDLDTAPQGVNEKSRSNQCRYEESIFPNESHYRHTERRGRLPDPQGSP